MIVKINNQKYQNIDYARLNDFVNSVITMSDYDIYLEFDKLNWLQVFKEDGFISIAHRVDKKVYQYFKLKEENKTNDLIKEYFFDKKLIIKQKPDEVVTAKNKSGINWLGFIIVIISLVFSSIFKDNNKYFNIGFLCLSFGIIIITYKSFINKEYDTKNDILFFGGILLFVVMLFLILFK